MLTNELRAQLIEAAREVRHNAYAPYSNYPVGSALVTKNGRIYTGVNVENAAYPSSMCAERVALFKAISEGDRDFVAIAVVTDNAGSPCGACRQVMAEFNPGMAVIMANPEGNILEETSVAELLPRAFRPEDLAT